jgi:TRAP-type C4-dicarboxylate transport system permease small subunit
MKFHDVVGNSLTARWVKKIYQTFLFASGAAIVLTMLATVLMRYIFQTDLFGIEEIILAVTIWFYFLGGANGSMEDSQICADVLTVLVKNETTRWALRLFTRVVEMVVLMFFIVLTTQLLITNYIRFPTTQGLKIPYIVPQMSIWVGFVLMFLYAAGHLIADLCSRPKPGLPRDDADA